MLEFVYSILAFIYECLFAVYRDLMGAMLLIRTRLKMRAFNRQNSNVFDEFVKLVRKHPNKACFIFEGQIWTFRDLEIYCNRIACLFQKRFGLKKGDCVVLFMESKPEYVGIWLGLSKLGVISALINTNLKHEPLLHSINEAKASLVVFGSSLEESLQTVLDKLDKNLPLVIEGEKPKSIKSALNLNEMILDNESFEVVEPNEKVNPNDVILYVYTSGTTGLPKPAVIKQSRFFGAGFPFFDAAGLSAHTDIVYVSLPIYHGNGGIIGVGAAIVSGATVVLRKKFSASQFWRDCIQHNCTAFVYVGEICRFLVNQPKSELDRAHKVKKAFGNGLRTNIWREFTERFGVQCMEIYGASEGNCSMINIVQKIGSCGFTPLVNKICPVFPLYVIKIDTKMNPIRDSRGFCIKCEPGESGLLVGIIGNNPVTAYNGYANNSQASRTKVLDNVFKKGQSGFNSGDLMMMDTLGYMYFCDRLGDTYRWRGENVSTIEVENVISRNLDSREVVVYGVEVPGQEGKAGMAALNFQPDALDLGLLGAQLKNELPNYAKPMFIRFVENVEHTGTFKAIKMRLVEESYNLMKVKDSIFYFDLKESAYKHLTHSIYENIINGNFRLL